MEYIQNKYGRNPKSKPIQKKLLKNNLLLNNKKGKNDSKGTATRKVFNMKAKPIQLPKMKK